MIKSNELLSSEQPCTCVVKNRKPEETQREWFKRWMCQWHWMETDYYQRKLDESEQRFPVESFMADNKAHDTLRLKLYKDE